jgi:hypothetical protein
MANKLTSLAHLKLLAQRAKAEIDATNSRLDDIVTSGGEPNKIEEFRVNGIAVGIANKIVDLLVAEGSTNGTVKVNNVDIAVKGLAALAFKAQVSEDDLETALKNVIAAKATKEELNAISGKVTTLVGSDADKSVRAISAEEVAKIVAGAPEDLNDLKELADWLKGHETDAAAMNGAIQQNKTDIANMVALVGTLPAGAVSTTVVGYIAEAVAAIGIGNYAKTAEVTAAINAALAKYSTTEQMNAAIKAVDDKLANYYTATQIDEMVATDTAVSAMLTQVFGE